MRTRLILNILLLLMPLATAQSEHQLNLMPMPLIIKAGSGELRIDQSFSVQVSGFRDSTLDRGVTRFVAQLSRQTGMLLKPASAENANATLLIQAEHGSEPVQKLGEDESYGLTVSETGAKLSAPNTLGILHG